MAVSTRTNGTAILSSSSDSQEQVIRLPAGFLLTPRDAVKKDIKWHETSIPEYKGYYTTILDDAFTPTECKILLKLAGLTTKGKWEQAMVNVGYGEQALMTETRDCGRILWDDKDIAERIWNRVKNHVPEIQYLRGMPHVTGQGPAKRNEVWRATRVNERMRFLKYGPGQYFRAHQDGCYENSETSERSYFTLHLYLSEDAEGGATSFHSWEDTWDPEHRRDVNVEPKIGRVLIFQQRGMLHSGADVKSGTKYTFRTDVMYRKEYDGVEGT